MEKTSYTIEQLAGVKAFAERAYDKLTVILGRTPSFREFMENQYKFADNKESVKTLFPHAIKGWELNNYPTEDYQVVYDDLFDPIKAETYVYSEVITNLFNKKSAISSKSSYLEQEESFEKNEETTVEIKNYKTILDNGLSILGGGSLFLAMIGCIGYVTYKSFVAESSQYQSLLLGAIFLIIIIISIQIGLMMIT